jgi:hypothetical protein
VIANGTTFLASYRAIQREQTEPSFLTSFHLQTVQAQQREQPAPKLLLQYEPSGDGKRYERDRSERRHSRSATVLLEHAGDERAARALVGGAVLNALFALGLAVVVGKEGAGEGSDRAEGFAAAIFMLGDAALAQVVGADAGLEGAEALAELVEVGEQVGAVMYLPAHPAAEVLQHLHRKGGDE